VGLVGQATVKLFASGFYAMRDTRTPVKIATFLAGGLDHTRLAVHEVARAPGIALGSSIGAFVQYRAPFARPDGRLGSVAAGTDWRAFGTTLVAGVLAGAAAIAVSRLTGSVAPYPEGLSCWVSLGLCTPPLTLALKHPDAVRTWQS